MTGERKPYCAQGQMFVCSACGKRSRDIYGVEAVDDGWDESCMLNAVLCNEQSLVIQDGRVVSAKATGLSAVH